MNKKIRTSIPLFPFLFSLILFILGLTSLLLFYFLVEEGDDKSIFLTILLLFLIVDLFVLLYSLFSNVTYKNGVIYNKFIITLKKVKKEDISKVYKKDEYYIIYKGNKKIATLIESDKKTHEILNELNLSQDKFEVE